MSRYYAIAITKPSQIGTISGDPLANNPLKLWTSYPSGIPDPGALNVELDLSVAPYAQPIGNSTVTIHGISLEDIRQATQFAGQYMAVYGGMKDGLPLATASQSGLLISGLILQSFANWVGTEMNINFVLNASTFIFAKPGNFVFNWGKGQSLKTAIDTMLNVAYPTAARYINISANYQTSAPVVHAVGTLAQMSSFLESHTKTPKSVGVSISVQADGSILVVDGTVKEGVVQIVFNDLIGQPRWVGGADSSNSYVMQFVTPMRADIQVGSLISMPAGLPNLPGAVTLQPGANPLNLLNLQTAFNGQFMVQKVRHIGNFRDPDGQAWSTVFEAVGQQ